MSPRYVRKSLVPIQSELVCEVNKNSSRSLLQIVSPAYLRLTKQNSKVSKKQLRLTLDRELCGERNIFT